MDGYFPQDIVIKIKHYIKPAPVRCLTSLLFHRWIVGLNLDNVVMTTTSSSIELRIQIEF